MNPDILNHYAFYERGSREYVIVIDPHIAAISPEWRQRILAKAIDDITAKILAGEFDNAELIAHSSAQ